MGEAYIVAAVRTAGGRRRGQLAGWHPADMAGEVLNALLDRTGIDPRAIEDVILGCGSQVGEQSFADPERLNVDGSVDGSAVALRSVRRVPNSWQR